MLDIETAFRKDDYVVFLRAEYEMPKELLDDSYKLFWEALSFKKYKVATYLLKKPYFNPFKATIKPSTWVSLICAIPSLLEIACEQHVHKDKISAIDAVIIVKSAVKIKFINNKGINNLIENFDYRDLDFNAKKMVSSLLGTALSLGEWYYAKKLLEWGAEINEKTLIEWSKVGFSIPLANKAKIASPKDPRASWPHLLLIPYRPLFIRSFHDMPENAIKALVTNNHFESFVAITKTFSDPEIKHKFVINVVKAALEKSKSEFSITLGKNLPKLANSVFKPNDYWLKILYKGKDIKLNHFEKSIIETNLQKIDNFLLSEINLNDITKPDLLFDALKKLPDWKASLCLRAAIRKLGIDNVVPFITKKQHLEGILCDDIDPMSVLIYAKKPNHQLILMEKMSSF